MSRATGPTPNVDVEQMILFANLKSLKIMSNLTISR